MAAATTANTPSRSKATPTSAARANTTSRSARAAPRRCATISPRAASSPAHAHDLLWQGAPGRGLQRHFVLVAEPPRRDRPRRHLVERGAVRQDSSPALPKRAPVCICGCWSNLVQVMSKSHFGPRSTAIMLQPAAGKPIPRHDPSRSLVGSQRGFGRRALRCRPPPPPRRIAAVGNRPHVREKQQTTGQEETEGPTTDQVLRIERLEAQIRQLTGTIEQLQYRNQQLENQLRGGRRQRPAGASAAAAAQPPVQAGAVQSAL